MLSRAVHVRTAVVRSVQAYSLAHDVGLCVDENPSGEGVSVGREPPLRLDRAHRVVDEEVLVPCCILKSGVGEMRWGKVR